MMASFMCQARFILTIGLLLGQVIRVASQGTVDASDLPACASQCASTAATAVGCNLSDTACLCSHPSFSDATRSCASSSCGIEDRSSVNGVLNNMCSATPSTSASGASSTQSSQSAASSQGGTRPSNSSPGSTGTASSNAPSSTNSSNALAGTVYSVGSSASQSSSSTVVVVQTVVLPQTTNFSGAVARVSLDFGFVGLGLVAGQAVTALVGAFLLL